MRVAPSAGSAVQWSEGPSTGVEEGRPKAANHPDHPQGGPWKGNIRVLMTKNFLLKVRCTRSARAWHRVGCVRIRHAKLAVLFALQKRMYTKLSCGFFPILLFMELIVPPGMLLGLTWVKMEAPLYMKLTGYGGWPVCNDNERHPCTQETPIECTAGQFGQIDVAGAAERAGVAGAKGAAEAAGGMQTVVSTCDSV